jgi:hypothetical protein
MKFDFTDLPRIDMQILAVLFLFVAIARGQASCASLDGAANVAACVANPLCYACPPSNAIATPACWARSLAGTPTTCSQLNKTTICAGYCSGGYNCGGVATTCAGVPTYATLTPPPTSRASAAWRARVPALLLLLLSLA